MSTLTEVVQDELGRFPVARRCCRRAEIATVLRLSAAVGHRDGTSTAAGRMFFQIKPIQSVRYRSWTPTELSIAATTTLGD